jgi:hypothetical protein
VVIPLVAGGRVALRPARGTAHLILDVVAFVTAPGGATAPGMHVAPRRVRTVDTGSDPGRYPAAADLPVLVAGRSGVPAGATSMTAIVTVVGGSADGAVSIAPLATKRAWTSVDVASRRGGKRSLLVTVPLGPTGAIVVRRSAQAHVVVDVVGWTVPRAPAVRPPDTSALQQPEIDLPVDPVPDPVPESAAEEQARLAARILVGSSRYALWARGGTRSSRCSRVSNSTTSRDPARPGPGSSGPPRPTRGPTPPVGWPTSASASRPT